MGRLLIIFKASHPLGPVFRLDAAALGPDVCRVVERAMPFQCPQFLKSDLPDRTAIHEEGVYESAVSVDADKIHFTGGGGYFFELSGAVGVGRVEVKPGTIKKQRYLIGIFLVPGFPVPCPDVPW